MMQAALVAVFFFLIYTVVNYVGPKLFRALYDLLPEEEDDF